MIQRRFVVKRAFFVFMPSRENVSSRRNFIHSLKKRKLRDFQEIGQLFLKKKEEHRWKSRRFCFFREYPEAG